jgi:hypothetical protein
MKSSLLKIGLVAVLGFLATSSGSLAQAKDPSPTTGQTKTFEGTDRDVAHEAAMKWVNDPNQHGTLINRIVVVERGGKWVATVTYTENK